MIDRTDLQLMLLEQICEMGEVDPKVQTENMLS